MNDSQPSNPMNPDDEELNRQAIERLEALIQEGIDSGPPIEVDDAFWDKKHRELDDFLGAQDWQAMIGE